LQETLKLLVRILRSPGCRKFPVLVKSADDVILAATKFVSERLCPIFQVNMIINSSQILQVWIIIFIWATCCKLILILSLLLSQVSNVTGENLDLLKMFMNLLGSRSPNTDDKPAEFQIDDTYSVPGIYIRTIG